MAGVRKVQDRYRRDSRWLSLFVQKWSRKCISVLASLCGSFEEGAMIVVGRGPCTNLFAPPVLSLELQLYLNPNGGSLVLSSKTKGCLYLPKVVRATQT